MSNVRRHQRHQWPQSKFDLLKRRQRRRLDVLQASSENHMIKVNVMYPYTEGARFDHTYYRDRHMPMVKARLGSACAYYTVEKGLTGRAPGEPPAFVAMCAFFCDSLEGYQA